MHKIINPWRRNGIAVCLAGVWGWNVFGAVDPVTATAMQAGVAAGTEARQNDFVFINGVYVTPRAEAELVVDGGTTNFVCLLPPDNGMTGPDITVNIGAVRPGEDKAYPVFPLPLYKQTVTVQFASPADAQAAYIRPVPIYHGYLYAMSGRFDDTDFGTVLSCEGLGAGGVNSTAFVNGLYFQGMESKQPPSKEQWARVIEAGSSIGNHSWHHGMSPATNEYDDAGTPIPDGVFDFSYPKAPPGRHFLDVLHPRAFYEAMLDTLVMSAAGPGNGYGTVNQYKNWINAGHYAFSYLKLQYPSSNVVWEEYDQGVILDEEKLMVRAREATHAQARVNPNTYKTMAEEIVEYADNMCWQTTWNDYGAYRYQYYHSPVIKTSVDGNEAIFEIYRPERIDLNNDTPLTWEIVGVSSGSVSSVGVASGSCHRVELIAGPNSDRYAFDLFHASSQKQLPGKIGFIGQYGDGVYRTDDFIQKEDADFPGITASFVITNGSACLTVTNSTAYHLENVVVTYRFPYGYEPETARVRLSGVIPAGSDFSCAPLTVTVSAEESAGDWIAGIQVDFTQNGEEGRLHIIGQSSDAERINNPLLPEPPVYNTLVYCDLSHYADQPDESRNVNTIRSGELIDFQTGASSGISVNMDGGYVENEPWFEEFGGISDAYRTFGVSMDHVGYIRGDVMFTFSGLNPTSFYEFAFTSAAEKSTTGRIRMVISGADAFINSSSPRTRMTGHSVTIGGHNGEISEALFADNVESGLVIRYEDVVPGSDGIVIFSATDNVYLSGYKVGVRDTNTPSNFWPLVWIDSPSSSLTLRPGDTVEFFGHASDTEDGLLTGNSLSWQIIKTGSGTVDTQTGTSGTWSVPADITEATTYEIKLLATDSAGATGTDSVILSVQPAEPPASALIRIGYDNFDGDACYLSRSNSSPGNTTGLTWDIVSRTNVAYDGFVDTSLYLVDGRAGDGADTLGIKKSTKTDFVFGMYRGGLTAPRTLTYVFDISGAEGLCLSMDWAACGDLPSPGITVAASIDGGTAQTVFEIQYAADNPVYVMEDGREVSYARSALALTNGTAAGRIDNEFKTFVSQIDGSGNELTVTLCMTSTGAARPYALDNLVVYASHETDADKDGLPDDWEKQYFGRTVAVDGNSIASNGFNTVREMYIAGLDPTDAKSRFGISGFSGNTLHWDSVSGRVYSVYWSTNLMNGFESLATHINWRQSAWTDQVYRTEGQVFYQLKVELEP